MHRGPTHSIITITVLMIPFFVVYRKQAIPYYAALLSHILIGDFFTAGGVQLFWPLSQNLFGALDIGMTSLTNMLTESGLFLITLPLVYKLGHLQKLLKPHNKNWALIIPLGAVLGPLLEVSRGPESALPILLVFPSLFYVALFAYSLFVEFRAWHNQDTEKPPPDIAPQIDSYFATQIATPSPKCSLPTDYLAKIR